jgi:hypothetical protein
MVYSPHDENTLKLHIAPDGFVWYSKGIGPAYNSSKTVDTFLLSSVLSGLGLYIRILGTARNAELIAALYLRHNKGEVRRIEVAGPNTLQNPQDVDDPRAVLRQLRQIALSPAAGGWHQLTMTDYPTYALLARMTRSNFVFDSAAETYLRLHPVHKALTFIPTVSMPAAAKLLVDIVDPRWYVDRRLPERTAKLELFLGLTPQIQNVVSNTDNILTKRREFRCQDVLNTWKTLSADEVDMRAPENFLYRVYAFHSGGPKGDLRASQAFVRYLRYNWLAALENRAGVKDGLFAPDLFFKMPGEVETYKQHMEAKT